MSTNKHNGMMIPQFTFDMLTHQYYTMLLDHICFIIYSFLLSNILRYVLELVQIILEWAVGWILKIE